MKEDMQEGSEEVLSGDRMVGGPAHDQAEDNTAVNGEMDVCEGVGEKEEDSEDEGESVEKEKEGGDTIGPIGANEQFLMAGSQYFGEKKGSLNLSAVYGVERKLKGESQNRKAQLSERTMSTHGDRSSSVRSDNCVVSTNGRKGSAQPYAMNGVGGPKPIQRAQSVGYTERRPSIARGQSGGSLRSLRSFQYNSMKKTVYSFGLTAWLQTSRIWKRAISGSTSGSMRHGTHFTDEDDREPSSHRRKRPPPQPNVYGSAVQSILVEEADDNHDIKNRLDTLLRRNRENNILRLEGRQRNEAWKEILYTIFLLFMDLVDSALVFTSYIIAWGVDGSSSPAFLFFTGIVFFSFVFVVHSTVKHTLILQKIAHQLKYGIEVDKTAMRLFLHEKRFTSEDQNRRIEEFSIESMIRKKKNAWDIAMNGIVVKGAVLVIVNWRIAFTDFGVPAWDCMLSTGLNNQTVGSNVSTPYYMDSGAAPIECWNEGFLIALLQNISTSFALAFKLSYLRDYWSYKERIAIERQRTEEKKLKRSSALDDLRNGQVLESEINSVVDIRELIKDNVETFQNGIVSDIYLLRFLRQSNGDAYESAQKFLEWARDRKATGMEEIRREFVLGDVSPDDIPGLRAFRAFLGLSFNCDPDLASNSLIFYATVINQCQLDRLLTSLESEPEHFMEQICEYLVLLLDSYCQTHQVMLNLRLLIDTSNAPICRMPGKLIESMEQAKRTFDKYGLTVDVVLWQPCEYYYHILGEYGLALENLDSVYIVDSIKEARYFISSKLIPIAIGGGLRMMPKGVNDPWGVARMPVQRLSVYNDQPPTRLLFFKNVTHEEIQLALEMKETLRLCEGRALSVLKFGPGEVEKVMADIERLISVFSSESESDKSRNANVDMMYAQREALSAIKAGVRLETVPVEHRNVCAILRWVRSGHEKAKSIPFLCAEFFSNCRWRKEVGLDQLNERIKKENMAVADLPNFQTFERQFPQVINPFAMFNASKGVIAGHLITRTDHDFLGVGLSIQTYQRAVMEVLEYYSILASVLSDRLEKLVQVNLFANANGVQIHHKNARQCLDPLLPILAGFPQLFKTPIFLATSRSITPSDHGIYEGPAKALANHRKIFHLYSTNNRLALRNFIDLEDLPIALGGTKMIRLTLKEYYQARNQLRIERLLSNRYKLHQASSSISRLVTVARAMASTSKQQK